MKRVAPAAGESRVIVIGTHRDYMLYIGPAVSPSLHYHSLREQVERELGRVSRDMRGGSARQEKQSTLSAVARVFD